MAFSLNMITQLLIIIFLLCSPKDVSITHQSSGSKKHGIITKLIHRDSILSPLYNPNETKADRVSRLVKMSEAHVVRRFSTQDDNIVSTKGIVLDLKKGNELPLYFIRFYIHNTSYPQLAIMDTGSPQIWVMCSSCSNCHDTEYEKFRPSDSPTYKPVGCYDMNCRENSHDAMYCAENLCYYEASYVLGINSAGIVGTDNFLFDDYSQDLPTMENVVFGCASDVYYNIQTEEWSMMGVFGLGQTGIFARRIEYFSYCIGFQDNIQDSAYSHLAIGEEVALLTGDSTPFVDGHDVMDYAAGLKGISIGTYEIAFTVSRASFDSGTTLTFLHPNFFNKVKIKLDSILKQKFSINRDYTAPANSVCYEGNVRAVGSFPKVTFSFVNNAKMVIEQRSLFMEWSNRRFCLSLRSSASLPVNIGNYSIIGSTSQTNYNLGFDVKGKMIYMSRTSCNFP